MWAPHDDASYQHVDAPSCSADGEVRPAYWRGASKQAHGGSAGGSYYAGVGEGRHLPTPTYRAGELSMVDYHRMIDHSLDTLTSQLEELMETQDIDALEEKAPQGSEEGEWDVEYATGVINVRLGSYGTYVINKQPPTQQLWLSSPTSGPKRFEYDTEKGVWFTYRDGELFLFHELLSQELSAVFDTPLSLHL